MIFAMMYPVQVVLRKCLYALRNTNFADLASAHAYSSLQASLKRVKYTGLSRGNIMRRSKLKLYCVPRSTGTHWRIYQDKTRERHFDWNQASSFRGLESIGCALSHRFGRWGSGTPS